MLSMTFSVFADNETDTNDTTTDEGSHDIGSDDGSNDIELYDDSTDDITDTADDGTDEETESEDDEGTDNEDGTEDQGTPARGVRRKHAAIDVSATEGNHAEPGRRGHRPRRPCPVDR